MTPAGIEQATFRFVAQHLNHCANLPRSLYNTEYSVEKHRLQEAASSTYFFTLGSRTHTEGQYESPALTPLLRDSPSFNLAEETLNRVGVTERNKQACHCTQTIYLSAPELFFFLILAHLYIKCE